MEDKIDLSTLDPEYIELIDLILNASPEQLAKIAKIINK